MSKIKSAACLAGALAVVTQAPVVSAAEAVSCKIGKQTYEFRPAREKRVSMDKLDGLDAKTKRGYTEVEWTYFKSGAMPRAAKAAAIVCNSTAFLKIGDIDMKKMPGLKISGDIYNKYP